jgi:hypothetical protein
MAAYFHPDMFRDDLRPETACDCGLPACRSGWPFPEQDRQKAQAALEREREAGLEAGE